MNKLLIIAGSTSTGKTDLALTLAKKFNGELVSCDSRQVYTGLDLGTGKFPGGRWKIEDGKWKKGKGFWEIDGIKIWMYDLISPKRQYTVYDYVKDAQKVIKDIIKRGKLPIIAGGSGLYLKALTEGLPNLAVPVDKKLRKQLEKLSLFKLQDKLQQISAVKWKQMNQSDKNNPRRLIRAIEIVESNHQGDQDDKVLLEIVSTLSNQLIIGLTAPREVLYQRSDERLIKRIKQGMIKEAERLKEEGLSLKRMRQLGLEYGVLADYLTGDISKKELINKLQNKIHGFIRRQITWFKKERDIFWFDIEDKNFNEKVEKLVAKWYDKADAT